MKDTLALLGGEKSVPESVANPELHPVPQKAYQTVEMLLKNNEISNSPLVKTFERRFADYIQTKYALCTVNGTTSIQAALFGAGVRAGDEVIVPSFTFWATVGPVVACGAVPVFADCDLISQTVTAETISKKITSRTKAVLLVHVWGVPCDMDPIMELAKKHGLKVIEDCSHAHGATYKGRKVGSIGDAGCFSMQGSKLLAAGEGGILVTNDRELYENATAYGHYERINSLGEDSPLRKYSITGFGYKHRVNPLGIAVADANLDRLDELNAFRQAGGDYLESSLSDIEFLQMQKVPEGAKRVYAYHYARFIPEKANDIGVLTFLKALAAEGVICGSCGYGKLHLQPLFVGGGPYAPGAPYYSPALNVTYTAPVASDLKNSELLNKNAVMIAPRFEKSGLETAEKYAAAYRKIARNLDALKDYQAAQGLAGQSITNKGTSINYFK